MPAPSLPGLNFDLGDTVDSLRDAIADFASEEIAPRAAAVDADNLFPTISGRSSAISACTA